MGRITRERSVDMAELIRWLKELIDGEDLENEGENLLEKAFAEMCKWESSLTSEEIRDVKQLYEKRKTCLKPKKRFLDAFRQTFQTLPNADCDESSLSHRDDTYVLPLLYKGRDEDPLREILCRKFKEAGWEAKYFGNGEQREGPSIIANMFPLAEMKDLVDQMNILGDCGSLSHKKKDAQTILARCWLDGKYKTLLKEISSYLDLKINHDGENTKEIPHLELWQKCYEANVKELWSSNSTKRTKVKNILDSIEWMRTTTPMFAEFARIDLTGVSSSDNTTREQVLDLAGKIRTQHMEGAKLSKPSVHTLKKTCEELQTHIEDMDTVREWLKNLESGDREKKYLFRENVIDRHQLVCQIQFTIAKATAEKQRGISISRM